MRLIGQFNKIEAGTALAFFCLTILVFTAKLTGWLHIYYYSAIAEFCLIIPLVFLVITGSRQNRPIVYYIQIELMLAWLVLELILNYILKIELRQLGWAVIGYVILFFAGSIGMISICFHTGKKWGIASVILFSTMFILVLFQQNTSRL
jgi:hypothetical protein